LQDLEELLWRLQQLAGDASGGMGLLVIKWVFVRGARSCDACKLSLQAFHCELQTFAILACATVCLNPAGDGSDVQPLHPAGSQQTGRSHCSLSRRQVSNQEGGYVSVDTAADFDGTSCC
jgi:hypothetical protein